MKLRRHVIGSVVVGAVALALSTGVPAQAQPAVTEITFDHDASGFVPNGFTSADSDRIAFYDSLGDDLELRDFEHQSNGVGLAANWDDSSALVMKLGRPARSISLAFGNDDPGFSNPGDRAVLTLFQNDRKVGEVSVEMNRDDALNQRIEYQGHPFNRAEFFYNVSTGGGLIEVVDDIRVG